MLLGFEAHETLLEQAQVRRLPWMAMGFLKSSMSPTSKIFFLRISTTSFCLQFFFKSLQPYFCCCFCCFAFPAASKVGNFDTFAVFDIHEPDTQGGFPEFPEFAGICLSMILKLNKMRQQRFEAAESLKFTLSVLDLVKQNDPGMADEFFLADGLRWRLY